MQVLRDIAPYVALGAAAADLVLLVLLVVMVRRVGQLRRSQQAVIGGHGERDLVEHAQHLEEQVRNLRMAIEALDATVARHKADLDHAFTHRAVVRYDAFSDIGGQQSASIALLDRHGSGLVISSIHSRDYARLYVKQLHEGVPDRPLAPEEEHVVAAAMRAAEPPGEPRPIPD